MLSSNLNKVQENVSLLVSWKDAHVENRFLGLHTLRKMNVAAPIRITPATAANKSAVPIVVGFDVEPPMIPLELSSMASKFDGVSEAMFEGIEDGIGDDDGTNVVVEGTLEDIVLVSMEKLRNGSVKAHMWRI